MLIEITLFSLLLGATFSVNSDSTYTAKKFRVPVDHFSFSTRDTFEIKYLVGDLHYKGGDSPILFYAGNEGKIELFANASGLLWDWAEEFGAMVVFIEHRYYGESMPYGDDSYKSLEKLGYLTVEQALADFAVTLEHIKKTYVKGEIRATNSPVVGFGGSYGGMLCAWMRMKYPNEIIGCLASSAPLMMFGDMVECNAFNKVVTEDFTKEGEFCSSNIRKSWATIDEIASTDAGIEKLNKLMGLCSPIKNKKDVTTLKYWMASNYQTLAMVDYPYPANFLAKLPGYPIKVACKNLAVKELEGEQLVLAVKEVQDVLWNYTGKVDCFDILKVSSDDVSDQGWYFQACGEMPMPFCADGVTDMFEVTEWTVDAFAEECAQQWYGLKMKKGWMQRQFGGRDITGFSNIIFSNGDLDPWKSGGVLKNRSDTLISIMIEGGAHHLDLRSSHSHDIPSVIAARLQEKAIVKQWLKEHKDNNGQHEHTCSPEDTYSYLGGVLNSTVVIMAMALLAAFLLVVTIMCISKGTKKETKSGYVYTEPPKIQIITAKKDLNVDNIKVKA